MPMSQAETFEWMRERLTRIDVELAAACEDAADLRAERDRLAEENVRLALEVARLKVRPVVEVERRGEDVGEVTGVRLDSGAASAAG